jgi:cytochrome c oxidase subunit 2
MARLFGDSMTLKNIARSVAAAALSGLAGMAQAVSDMPGGPKVLQLNLGEPASAIARGQIYIHDVLLWVCVVIFVLVFGVMFYSIFAHRKSKGHKPADFHESTSVEIAWTVVPFIIVVALGAIATGDVVAQKDTSNSDLTIKATGYQWKWGYDYLKGEGEGISMLSMLTTPRDADRRPQLPRRPRQARKEQHLPAGGRQPAGGAGRQEGPHPDHRQRRDPRLVVPALGVKQDAIPGFVRDTWFKAEKTGTFRGQCAELCGKDHAFMPIVVEVKSEADYKAWVDGKKKEMLAKRRRPAKEWSVADLQARGEKVYAANCVACHQATGKGVPGAFPALDGSKVVLGPQDPQIACCSTARPVPRWPRSSSSPIPNWPRS